jgi:starch phosphorylase
MPLIGIGIKWKQGYSDQYVDDEGKVYDSYNNYTYVF